jgi:hypothetical protein
MEIGNPIGIIMGYIDLNNEGEAYARGKKDFLTRVEW